MTGDPEVDAALLGAAWLVYAGESGDGAARATGLDHLDRAAARAPEHADRTEWWYLLGLGGRSDALDAATTALERRASGTGDRRAWYDLAEAYLVRWQVDGAAESAFQAGRCLDRVLAPGTPDDALALSAHTLRLYLAGERDDPVRLRAVLADSGRALDRAGAPGWGVLAGLLAYGELCASGYDGGAYDTARVRARVALARRVPDPPPAWTTLLDTVESLALFADDVADAHASGERAMAAYPVAVPAGGADVLPFLLHLRAVRAGDLRGIDAARSLLTRDADILTKAVLALDQARWGDPDGVQTLAAQVDELLSGLPDDHILVPMLGFARPLHDGSDRPVTLPDTVPDRVEPHDTRTVGLLLTGTAAAVQAVHHKDSRALAAAAGYLDRLATAIPPGHALRLAAAGLAAAAWRDLARESGGGPAAARAVRWFEEMVAVTGGPHHPLWTAQALGLAESLRLAGDPDRSRTRVLGLAALRGYAWHVLAQAGTDYALRAARTVAAQANRVTAWCLADGAYDELLPVLDAGRGLALAAAATSRSVADRLAALGAPDLAAEWCRTNGLGRDRRTGAPLPERAAPAEVPDDLRDRVVRALSGGDCGEVTLDEVQAALTTTGYDALVYLVPAPGAAVVVPASGTVDVVPLPRLGIGPQIGRWLADRDAWSLDRLCAWAWPAAVQPLVGYTRRLCLSRPARLVLVPMGALGLVPWHAAYTGSGTARRYATADLVLSYSVSARMFCAASRYPLRRTVSALIVGNPGGDLPYAGAEARAIHHRFHPDGAFLGDGGDKATPRRVLDWIAQATSPSLVHLACHGTGTPTDAHLVLADGAHLSAGALLEASRLAGLSLDQVYLAACTTHAVGTDYDESFSLATAFLAAGAHTVFGSLWPVPDEDTSLLMYLVHHHLDAGCTPVDALHRAQRWMTDLYRRPPDRMPVELLRAAWGRSPAQPGAWAGFIHLGR